MERSVIFNKKKPEKEKKKLGRGEKMTKPC
jgi:hypothetical protein